MGIYIYIYIDCQARLWPTGFGDTVALYLLFFSSFFVRSKFYLSERVQHTMRFVVVFSSPLV